MSQKVGPNNNKVFRLVLTGGPCGGKTTGQARLCTFFENIGWKVYRVPETATILLGGGVKFTDLSDEEVYQFQENFIRTMMQIEQTFFDLAATCSQNCLVICDRGIMDATAYLKPGQWDRMKKANKWNEVELRDERYSGVIHMVSAAKGAEEFYNTSNNSTRKENLELARTLDDYVSQAWVGHPYYDVIDNDTHNFETKVVRMIAAVCNRLGIDTGDRLSRDSRKRKFLVECLPAEMDLYNSSISAEKYHLVDENGIHLVNAYPQFQDFIVVHDYLVTPNSKLQARIRKRGQNVKWDSDKGRWDLETGHWTNTHTIRKPQINKETVELKMQISSREYELLRAQRDHAHYTIYKKRRCFLWNNQYFQMDIYQEPCHPRCRGLIILETYTTLKGDDLKLPDFLKITKEVTEDPSFSMYNLSKQEPPLPQVVQEKENNEEQQKQNNDSCSNNKAIDSIPDGPAVVNGTAIANGHT